MSGSAASSDKGSSSTQVSGGIPGRTGSSNPHGGNRMMAIATAISTATTAPNCRSISGTGPSRLSTGRRCNCAVPMATASVIATKP